MKEIESLLRLAGNGLSVTTFYNPFDKPPKIIGSIKISGLEGAYGFRINDAVMGRNYQLLMESKPAYKSHQNAKEAGDKLIDWAQKTDFTECL